MTLTHACDAPRRTYYCRECEVSVGPLTQDEALAEIEAGHTLFSDPAPMSVSDAVADAETLLTNYPNILGVQEHSEASWRRLLSAQCFCLADPHAANDAELISGHAFRAVPGLTED